MLSNLATRKVLSGSHPAIRLSNQRFAASEDFLLKEARKLAMLRCLILLALLVYLSYARSCSDGDPGCIGCDWPLFQPNIDCPRSGFDCSEDSHANHLFNVSESPRTRCHRLTCADPDARLFVNGREYHTLRCRNYRWQSGPSSCDATLHAVCAKPCKCATARPKSLPTDYKNADILPSSPHNRCPRARCLARGSDLFGVRADGTVVHVPDSSLSCTGHATWTDSEGDEFTHVACRPSCSSCPKINYLSSTPTGYLEIEDQQLTPYALADTCAYMACGGNIDEKNIAIDIDPNHVTKMLNCTSLGKWVSFEGEPVTEAVCVEEITERLLAPVGVDKNPQIDSETLPEASESTTTTAATAEESTTTVTSDETLLMSTSTPPPLKALPPFSDTTSVPIPTTTETATSPKMESTSTQPPATSQSTITPPSESTTSAPDSTTSEVPSAANVEGQDVETTTSESLESTSTTVSADEDASTSTSTSTPIPEEEGSSTSTPATLEVEAERTIFTTESPEGEASISTTSTEPPSEVRANTASATSESTTTPRDESSTTSTPFPAEAISTTEVPSTTETAP